MQQSDPYPQLQPVTVTSTKIGGQIYDQPLDSSSLMFLAGATANAWNGLLARMGCRGGSQTLLAVATVVAAPEAAEAEAAATAEETAAAAPDFVVTSDGTAIPIPEGATGPYPTQSPGFMFNGGAGGNGLADNVTDVRIMDPNAANSGRIRQLRKSSE